jgi:hypothetical protein
MDSVNCVLLVVVLVLVVMCCVKKETFLNRTKCIKNKTRYCGNWNANSWDSVATSDRSICYKQSDQSKPIDVCKRHREGRDISKTRAWFKAAVDRIPMIGEGGREVPHLKLPIYVNPKRHRKRHRKRR